MALPEELASLPEPEVIDALSFEASATAAIARLKAEFDEVGIDYDVDMLETDPGVVLMQVAAYIDVNLRQRINEAVRATLLAYATGIALDHLAQFYDVTRLMGETDAALRRRVVLAIRGRSPGGTEPRYKSVALSADPRVADAAIFTEGRDPTIRVAIFSTENGGIANEELVGIVDAALQDPSVRLVNDRIVVSAAARQSVDVTANVWLLPNTSGGITTAMESALRAAWAAQMGLGRNVSRSWVSAQLMLPGVQRIEIIAPASDVVIPSGQAAALGIVSIVIVGRDY